MESRSKHMDCFIYLDSFYIDLLNAALWLLSTNSTLIVFMTNWEIQQLSWWQICGEHPPLAYKKNPLAFFVPLAFFICFLKILFCFKGGKKFTCFVICSYFFISTKPRKLLDSLLQQPQWLPILEKVSFLVFVSDIHYWHSTEHTRKSWQ